MPTAPLHLIADAVQAVPPAGNDFAPAGFVILFLVLVGCLLLLAAAAALLLVIGAASLVAAGMVSASVLVALSRRRVSAGLRALAYQLCIAAALPAGVAVLWLGNMLFTLHLRHVVILLLGVTAGVVTGLSVASVLDRFSYFLRQQVVKRFATPTAEAIGVLPGSPQVH